MLVTELRRCVFDPEFEGLHRFLNDPQAFNEAFARAVVQTDARSRGTKARYIGPEVPKEDLIWQDPLPQPLYQPTQEKTLSTQAAIAASGLFLLANGFGCWASRLLTRRR